MKCHEVLRLENVSFEYEKDQAILKKLNFHMMSGEFVSIIGASGTGKSTIFRLIVGLEEASSGSIYVNGEKLDNRLGKVGFMPQKDLLIPWRTVTENVLIACEGRDKRVRKDLIDGQLNDLGLGHVRHKYPHELSGGMRQRVSFLRASQSESNLLLLDEPFSALDAMTKLYMQEWLLKQWQHTNSSILFITHDILEALYLSNRILVIQEAPIHSVIEMKVPLARPRSRSHLDTKEMIELKNELMSLFQMQVIE